MYPMPFLFFALGVIVASFVGVVVARLNTNQGFLGGRSRCDSCGEALTFAALVPVFSYLATRGHAQCCGARLTPRAPLSELALGVLFVLAYHLLGLSWALAFFLIALALLLALVLYDLAHQILPTSLLVPFVVVSALAGFFIAPSLAAYAQDVLAAVAIAGVLFAIHFFSRGRAMGFADAPFAFGLSLLTGPAAFPGFVFSFWIGAGIGIVLLLSRPRGSRMGVEVPFAPFLAAGFILAFFTQWNPFAFVTVMF